MPFRRSLSGERMKKAFIALAALVVVAIAFQPVFAATIRLDPHGSYYGQPTMLSSPATFNVYVQPSGDPTSDPHILLVMTETCYNALTDDVTVEWSDGSITITSWSKASVLSEKVPPDADSGTGYTVALLKDHLDTSEDIYWAFEGILDGEPLTTTPAEFTITLPSTDPRMMVYVLGKTGDSELFNNRVPPTQPGFVVPEVATIFIAASSMLALGAYACMRKKITKRI